MKKTRIIYLDILKILAIILVIYNHSHWYITDNDTFTRLFHYGSWAVCKIAIPVFLMVTGALLLGRKTSYKEIMTKRIFRLIIPLLLILCINILIYGGSFWQFVLSIFVTYQIPEYPYWLWYIYLLITLYLLTPFLQKLISKFTEKDYNIFFILFILLPSIGNMFQLLATDISGTTMYINDSFLFTNITPCVGLYVLGYYLKDIQFTNKRLIIGGIISILCMLGNAIYLYCGIVYAQLSFDTLLSYQFITILFPAIYVFALFKHLFTNNEPSKLNSIIGNISNCVFGTYLFHVYIIRGLYETSVFKTIFSVNSILGVITLDIITFIICIVGILLLRKIKIFRKFL